MIKLTCDSCNKPAEVLFGEDGNPINYGQSEVSICAKCKDKMHEELHIEDKKIKDKYFKKK